MSPLRVSDPGCFAESPEFIARQAARPDSWRDQWPDDPRLAAIRDHLSHLFRRHFGFKTDAFLPDDEMGAIFEMSDSPTGDTRLIFLVELSFDIVIDDEIRQKILHDTYLGFVELILKLAAPDYESKVDAVFLQPLRLPIGFHRMEGSTFWRKFPVFGRDSRQHRALRKSQAWRSDCTPRWVKRWPEERGLISMRDEVSRLLVDRLDWFDRAFLPDDQLAALFHHKLGREYIPVVLADLNRVLGTTLDVDFIINNDRTYLDLLRHIQTQREARQLEKRA